MKKKQFPNFLQMNDFVRDKFMKEDGRIDLKYEILAGGTVRSCTAV